MADADVAVEDVNSGRDSRGSQRDKKKDKKDKKDKKNKKGSRDGNGDDEGVEMQDLWALMLQRNGRQSPKKHDTLLDSYRLIEDYFYVVSYSNLNSNSVNYTFTNINLNIYKK